MTFRTYGPRRHHTSETGGGGGGGYSTRRTIVALQTRVWGGGLEDREARGTRGRRYNTNNEVTTVLNWLDIDLEHARL